MTRHPLPPFMLVMYIWTMTCDSDMVRLTGELMGINVTNIVSVWLGNVQDHLQDVIKYLPQCPSLSALRIGYMSIKENQARIVEMIPRLTQIDTIRYYGSRGVDAATLDIIAAVLRLKKLRCIVLGQVCLSDEGKFQTAGRKRLQTVELWEVSMSSKNWERFVSSLLTIRHPVDVSLQNTTIDADTVEKIQTSPHFNVKNDNQGRTVGWYSILNFTTIPPNATCCRCCIV